ncbi:DUF6674 family protein [Lachnospiraceae bacterium HCP1S3_C3]
MEEMVKTSMTKDEIIMELMELLKQNDRKKQASKTLKETLSEMVDRAEKRCDEMKQKLFEVKEDMKEKATEIITEFKKKGKEALNKVSEFFGVKKKLEKIRDKVREGIVETDITLARIDGFTEGVHVANQQIANSFRVLAGKDQKDYSQEIFKADNSMLRKPWAWQKRVYQNLELHLDAAIDKVENLSLDVRNQNYEEIKKIADRDEKKVAAEKAKDQMDSYTTSVITPIMGVAEGEHKYGADAFEEFMANNQGDKDKGKAPVDVAPVKKDEKRR